MAINLEALQKKLSQLSGQNTRKNLTWRPPEGEEVTVRIIAFPNNDGSPFKERWFYYGIGNNMSLLAPHQFGKPDPIQELIDKLRADKSPATSKQSYELAKKLYPKMRSYAAIVVRGEEDKGVRIWPFGKSVYQELIKIMLDSDYGDITDLEKGYDIKVNCAKLPGKKFAETTVRARAKQSPLTNDKNQLTKWLNSIPDLDELYTLKSYGELEQIINAWLENPNSSDGTTRGGDDDDDDSSESSSKSEPTPEVSEKTSSKESVSSPKKSPKTTKTAEASNPTSAMADLDKAFADLEDF